MINTSLNELRAVVIGLVTLLLTTGCMSKSILNLQMGNPFAEHQWNHSASQIELPFTWYDGHIMIELTINDSQPLQFAFDSGASATVLFETNRTSKMKLSVDNTLDLAGSTVNLIDNTSVKVGNVHIENLTIIHVPIDQSPLFRSFDDAYFDGAIGYDLLKHYTTKIDYQNQTVTLYKKYNIAEVTSDWKVFPIQVKGNIPYINTLLKDDLGRKTQQAFVVDTGAPDYIYINTSMIDELSFPDAHFLGYMNNFEGEQQIKTGKIPFFEMADTRFSNVTSHDLPQFKDNHGVGLIGSGLLRKFDVIFDYQTELMAFKRAKHWQNQTAIDRSGLKMEPHINGGIVISVAENTGAHQLALQSGDVVTHIDNNAISSDNFDSLRLLLSSNAKSVGICWERDTKSRCGELILASRL